MYPKLHSKVRHSVEIFILWIFANWYDSFDKIGTIRKTKYTNYQFSWHKSLNLYFLDNLENEDFHYSANANIDRQEIDYISPINVQKNNHLHTIPEIVIFTHYLFLLFKNNLTDKEGENFNVFEFCDYKFPNPVLKVEYKDLNGKKYKNEYKFQLCAVDTQVEEKLDLTKEFAYLHFELI